MCEVWRSASDGEALNAGQDVERRFERLGCRVMLVDETADVGFGLSIGVAGRMTEILPYGGNHCRFWRVPLRGMDCRIKSGNDVDGLNDGDGFRRALDPSWALLPDGQIIQAIHRPQCPALLEKIF
jgi:hypothetical protein